MNSWLLDISSNTASSSRQYIGANLNQGLISSNQMIFFSNSVCIYKFYVCVCMCGILDLPGISSVSANSNFLVSEVGECLLGSIIFFLFSDWHGVRIPNAALWERHGGALWELCFLRSCFEYPNLLSFTFCYLTSLSCRDVKSTELWLEFQAYTKANGGMRIELLQ